jgi:hypothetical protein
MPEKSKEYLIFDLWNEIQVHKYWIDRTTHDYKIRQRKREIKRLEEEIKKLKS